MKAKMKTIKVYLVSGYQYHTEEDDYQNRWSLTLTDPYLIEAHTNKTVAQNRIKELRAAVELWDRALRDKSIMEGVRGEVFLNELAEKAGDRRLSSDSTYDLSEIQVIKD